MPPNWGSPNPLAEHVEDLNLWLQGASVHVQVRRLHVAELTDAPVQLLVSQSSWGGTAVLSRRPIHGAS